MASDVAAQWPQYRKFISAPSRREIASRALLGVAVAGAVAAALYPGEESAARAEPAVKYVTLPRVVVTAKREARELATTAPAGAVRLVVGRE